MNVRRNFLIKLYENRIEDIPFLKYFQNNKSLKRILFRYYIQNEQQFESISLLQDLKHIDIILKDFNEVVLNDLNVDMREYSKTTFQNVIYELNQINIPELTKLLLNDFLNTRQNIELEATIIVEDLHNSQFQDTYGLTIKEAERKYRELKRYANNHITLYLKELDEKENILLNKFKKDSVDLDIEKSQNKLIPKVSIEAVYNHFKILTTDVNKHNEFYLTPEQLNTFIKSTFIDLKPIKQSFNCEERFVKRKVRNIFYKFYNSCKNKEYNQTSLKRKYFNIMNDSFIGFNENDYTDFAK